MSGKPLMTPAATLTRSPLRRDQNFRSAIGRHQVLERHHTAIRKSNRLIRNRNARRNVRIIKGIVERIAKENEASMVMRSNHSDTSKPEATAIRITVAVRARHKSYVDPSLSRATAHVPDRLLLRCAPSQPNRILRHTCADLALFHQSLVARRKAVKDFRMIRNARFSSRATGEN